MTFPVLPSSASHLSFPQYRFPVFCLVVFVCPILFCSHCDERASSSLSATLVVSTTSVGSLTLAPSAATLAFATQGEGGGAGSTLGRATQGLLGLFLSSQSGFPSPMTSLPIGPSKYSSTCRLLVAITASQPQAARAHEHEPFFYSIHSVSSSVSPKARSPYSMTQQKLALPLSLLITCN